MENRLINFTINKAIIYPIPTPTIPTPTISDTFTATLTEPTPTIPTPTISDTLTATITEPTPSVTITQTIIPITIQQSDVIGDADYTYTRDSGSSLQIPTGIHPGSNSGLTSIVVRCDIDLNMSPSPTGLIFEIGAGGNGCALYINNGSRLYWQISDGTTNLRGANSKLERSADISNYSGVIIVEVTASASQREMAIFINGERKARSINIPSHKFKVSNQIAGTNLGGWIEVFGNFAVKNTRLNSHGETLTNANYLNPRNSLLLGKVWINSYLDVS
tara:strand:- start:2271 stop:3098 length:828 start_codon:yes stop_codon:yes gene_type:complete